MTISQDRINDAHLMVADGLVYLYEITLVSGPIIYVKADNSVTWQGNTYEGTAIQIDQRGKNSDGQWIRPKLTIANPMGAYSALVAQKLMDNASVVEKQVLKANIDANNNTYSQKKWRIRRTLSLNRISAQFEIRDMMDGQLFILPARMYVPPEFPSVTL